MSCFGRCLPLSPSSCVLPCFLGLIFLQFFSGLVAPPHSGSGTDMKPALCVIRHRDHANILNHKLWWVWIPAADTTHSLTTNNLNTSFQSAGHSTQSIQMLDDNVAMSGDYWRSARHSHTAKYDHSVYADFDWYRMPCDASGRISNSSREDCYDFRTSTAHHQYTLHAFSEYL